MYCHSQDLYDHNFYLIHSEDTNVLVMTSLLAKSHYYKNYFTKKLIDNSESLMNDFECLENPVIWINLQKHSHFPKLSILSHQILLKIIMIIAAVNSFSTFFFKAMHGQMMTRELINEYCPQLICATAEFFFGQKGKNCS